MVYILYDKPYWNSNSYYIHVIGEVNQYLLSWYKLLMFADTVVALLNLNKLTCSNRGKSAHKFGCSQFSMMIHTNRGRICANFCSENLCLRRHSWLGTLYLSVAITADHLTGAQQIAADKWAFGPKFLSGSRIPPDIVSF